MIHPTHTATTIVISVTMVKMSVTATTAQTSPAAAGYIRTGIKGSQGPKRKMVNSTHGVIRPALWSVAALDA